MKLIYLIWGYSHDTDILQTFQEAGIIADTIVLPSELKQKTEENSSVQQKKEQRELEEIQYHLLKEQIRTAGGDAVFSINFFSKVSYICQEEGIPYWSWVLQLPNFDLYTAAIQNICNYFFICDSYLVEKFWQLGITKTFFLPDAVRADMERKTVPIEREACFIARCPKAALNTEGMSAYGKGYLDAFIHAQRVLYGANILENGLLFRVQKEFMKSIENDPFPENILPKMQKLFIADQYFAPVCTQVQQHIFLQNFDSIMTIYSDGDFTDCSSAEKKPFIEEEEKRREIYVRKEFTLVLAPHVLHNGIPRDLLEVIAAGGFPIAGFQRDYAYFFKRDETLAYFTNPSEFSRAVVRYGNSIEERERVKEAAYQMVIKGHTYLHRMIAMLEVWKNHEKEMR